jgi:SAM-dependent methyltransferase
VSEVWSAGTYERFSALFEPIHDELVERLRPRAGERWLDVVTGNGAVAVRAARAGAEVTALDVAEPLLEQARRAAEDAGVEIRLDAGDAEYLPYDDGSFDVVVSNFGLIFARDHANVAAELARVLRVGGRLGFTAWEPDERLGDLYRRFTNEPLPGLEAYEWGREDHVEDMLGDDFELELHDGTIWLTADSGADVWSLSAASAPVTALLDRLDDDRADEFRRAFAQHYETFRADGGIRAPRRYLLVLGRRR